MTSPLARPGTREFLFLGTGTSVGVPTLGCDCAVCLSDDPRLKRTRPSVLISSPAGRLLIDTGPDMRAQLLRERVPFAHGILFTHQHVDHTFGLDDVRTFSRHLEGPVPVWCDPHVEDFIRRTFSYAFDPVVQAYPAGGLPKLDFRRLERPATRILDHEVMPIPLKHGRYDVLGFRFGPIAYCTDTNHVPEESMALLRDLDILVLDALRHDSHPTHFSLGEALAVIEELKPRKAYLTHIGCRMDPARARAECPPNVELAWDGLRFPF
jgi:phosphoribosyl 1,2-cyclic phosphate phosphodiesterase